MRFFLLFISLLAIQIFAQQTDWLKWEKNEISYTYKNQVSENNFSQQGISLSQLMIESLAKAYWFLISDLDGDNCPFNPSCSKFFIQAVQETNLPQGVLMFFDRFTRDINIFNREKKYPRLNKRYFYDPIELYTLDENNIRYLPPDKIITIE